MSLDIYLDRSGVEAFVNNCELVLTDRIHPSPLSQGIELFSDSPAARVIRLRIGKLKPVLE